MKCACAMEVCLLSFLKQTLTSCRLQAAASGLHRNAKSELLVDYLSLQSFLVEWRLSPGICFIWLKTVGDL